MWCYGILKKRRQSPIETDDEARLRLSQMAGAVAVEVFLVADSPELAGRVYIRAFGDGGTGERKLDSDAPDERRDALAALLLEHSDALPGTTKLFWLDDGGAIAEHLHEDLEQVGAFVQRRGAKAKEAMESGLRDFFGGGSGGGGGNGDGGLGGFGRRGGRGPLA